MKKEEEEKEKEEEEEAEEERKETHAKKMKRREKARRSKTRTVRGDSSDGEGRERGIRLGRDEKQRRLIYRYRCSVLRRNGLR